MSATCIIPARGGSKRIPRKNVIDFHGKPLIAWSILSAIESGCFERVVVSTDDQEIAEIAKQYGAETPFMRPNDLADDFTGTIEVIQHAIEFVEQQGNSADFYCCIYATAPLLKARFLSEAYDKLQTFLDAFVFSATEYNYPIQRSFKIKDDGRMEFMFPEFAMTRSQDLVNVYHDAGQFYWANADTWKNSKSILNETSVPVLLPSYYVQDIDTLEDLKRAEALFAAIKAMEPT